MPHKRGKVPSYCRHKASGQAVVRIADRDHYLGEYGSPESHEEYERRIAEWRANPSPTTGKSSETHMATAGIFRHRGEWRRKRDC